MYLSKMHCELSSNFSSDKADTAHLKKNLNLQSYTCPSAIGQASMEEIVFTTQ